MKRILLGRHAPLAATLLGAALAMGACGGDDDDDKGGGDGDGDGVGGSVISGDGDGDGAGGNGVGGNGAGGVSVAVGGNGVGGGATGGMGGDNLGGGAGEAGDGDGDGDEVDCPESAILFVPFTMEDTGTDFELAYEDIDMSATVVTFRIKAMTEGNAGGLKIYAKNGEAVAYASNYGDWYNFGDLADWTDVTLDLGALDDAPDPNDDNVFDKSLVLNVGINLAAGGTWDGAMWSGTTVCVDSITFSDGAADDVTFDADADALSINEFNSPLDGSTVTWGGN